MSRQDYVAIAAAIRNVVDLDPSEVAVATLDLVTLNIANALEKDNPRFDRARFLEAALGEGL